jgi:hypothetical protein
MDMNDPVRVKLSEHDLAERAGQMAAKLEHVRVLRTKKSDDAKSTQTLIDEELDTLAAMARVILDAEDDARQGDLFVDGTLGQVASEIAGRCICAGGPTADVKDPNCRVHGVERNADGTAKDAGEHIKCDGNHGGPVCVDPECWQRDVDDLADDLRAARIGSDADGDAA